jgi:hypothetical protein
MEFRILGNENPLGSRRAFEDRVNLHLAVGWQLHGALVAEAVKAGDWQPGLGLHRPAESLFVFQGILHPRSTALVHLQTVANEYRWLQDKPEAERSHADLRRLKALHSYLNEELDYHGELFPDKEAQEEASDLRVSKERLKKDALPPPKITLNPKTPWPPSLSEPPAGEPS